MGPRVGGAKLQSLRNPLRQFRLQGVVMCVGIGSGDIRNREVESRLQCGFSNRYRYSYLGNAAIEHTGADSSLRISRIATAAGERSRSHACSDGLLDKSWIGWNRIESADDPSCVRPHVVDFQNEIRPQVALYTEIPVLAGRHLQIGIQQRHHLVLPVHKGQTRRGALREGNRLWRGRSRESIEYCLLERRISTRIAKQIVEDA